MSRERIMLTQAIPAVQQLRRVQGGDCLGQHMAPSTKKMTRRSSAGHILPKSPMFWNTLQAKLMILRLSRWQKAPNL